MKEEIKMSRQRKWQIKRHEEGRCIICGKEATKGKRVKFSGYCEPHLEKVKTRSRNYQRIRYAKYKKEQRA